MYLTDLIHKSGLNNTVTFEDNVERLEISGVETDSRKICPGCLFIAVPGTRADGLDYIPQALKAGAVALMLSSEADLSSLHIPDSIPVLQSPCIRKDAARIAASFYPHQAETQVAVTGTNGKTSVVNFVRQIWEMFDLNAGSLGTVGLHTQSEFIPAALTTPDPVSLHKDINRAVQNGLTHLALEASSHGLEQCRLDGLKIHAAGFTNLTHEHLDYHETYENYRAAKGRLFNEILKDGGVAVLNADSKEFGFYKKLCDARDIKSFSYGYKGQDFKILERFPAPSGQDIRLRVFGKDIDFFLPLVGEFQLMNVLCACALALQGVPKAREHVEEVFQSLEHLKSVRGRLEKVPGHRAGAEIYVDYAHSPDALETVLKTLRPHVAGRLVCVFGCGGDRDKRKRPMMGKIASELSDKVIVTDDNPRTEDPASIRAQIMHAAPEAKEIGSRRMAIEHALKDLKDGDVLLVAGKGHEQGQLIGDILHPFDDAEEIRKALKKMEEAG